MVLIKLAILCFLFRTTTKFLAMNFIAIKSKIYNFSLRNLVMTRNLDSRTEMLEDHASQGIYNS